MSLLDRYLAMENYHETQTSNDIAPDELPVPEVEVPEVRDVTEDEIEEAEELLEELNASEVEQERAVEEVSRVEEEVSIAVESFDSLLKVFKHGIETQQYSAQFAAFAAASLEHYAEIMPEIATPSFEDFTEDDLGEYYAKMVTALEDHVTEATGRSAAGVFSKLNTFVGGMIDKSRKKRIQAIITKIDKAISELNALPDGTVEVKVGPLMRRRLSIGGDIPSSLVEGVKKERATFNWIFNTYWKAAVDYHTSIYKLIQESRELSSQNELAKLIGQKLPSKTPESNFPDAVRKGTGLFGNFKYEPKDTPYTKGISGEDVIGMMGRVTQVHLDYAPGEKTVKVSKAELVKLLQEMKATSTFLSDSIDRITKDLNTVITNSQPVYHRGGKKGWFFLASVQRTRLTTWASAYAWIFVPFINQVATNGIKSQKGLLSFVGKAKKQLEKAK